jgi:hypothetical protein
MVYAARRQQAMEGQAMRRRAMQQQAQAAPTQEQGVAPEFAPQDLWDVVQRWEIAIKNHRRHGVVCNQRCVLELTLVLVVPTGSQSKAVVNMNSFCSVYVVLTKVGDE